jgi:hypothetical protein
MPAQVLLAASGRQQQWINLIAKIKICHDVCDSNFKDCTMTIDQNKKIKNWISDYQEKAAHLDILSRTQVDERYQNCGEWLVTSPQFIKWSSTSYDLERYVFWLRGTGQNTFLWRQYSLIIDSWDWKDNVNVRL